MGFIERGVSLSNADVAALLSTIRRCTLALLERQGMIESSAEPSLADDEPVLPVRRS